MANDNMEFQNGALIDTRTKEQKEKDYNINEIVSSVAVVDWKEKPESEWRKFPDQNQGPSGSCVMSSLKKIASVLLWLKEKTYVPFSGAFYQLRSNKPAGGMIGVEAFEIWRKNGLPLEQLVPSENMTDAEMDAIKVEQYEKEIAEVFKISNHIGIDNGDFETVASVIQKTGKAVMAWFYFTSEEWSKLIPTVDVQNLNIITALRHSVAVVDYFLYNGKKYLLIEDSAHFGGLTRRLISEDFFRARNFFIRYPMTFQFQEKVEEENIVVDINFEKDLEFGMKDQDVVTLQNLLKELGYFPANIESTGYYGAISVKAVRDFQLAKGIISSIKGLGAGRCGPLTRAFINNNY
jgi:hypothetical protein